MVHLPQHGTKTALTHSHIDISKTFSCGVPCPPAMLFTQVWVKKSATRNWTAGFGLWFHLPGLAPFWSHPIFDNHRQVVLRPAFAGQEVCTPSTSFAWLARLLAFLFARCLFVWQKNKTESQHPNANVRRGVVAGVPEPKSSLALMSLAR